MLGSQPGFNEVCRYLTFVRASCPKEILPVTLPKHGGRTVYGGSVLHVARGLSFQDLPAPHLAVVLMPDRENLAFEPGRESTVGKLREQLWLQQSGIPCLVGARLSQPLQVAKVLAAG